MYQCSSGHRRYALCLANALKRPSEKALMCKATASMGIDIDLTSLAAGCSRCLPN